MTKLKTSAAILLALSLSACKVGPNYKRPATTVPDQYRGIAPSASSQAPAQPIADTPWASVYQDEVLQGLIKEALTNNYDIRIAATRVLEANANLGITRSYQFPMVNGSGSVINQRDQLTNLGTDKSPTYDTLALSLSYIVDFWGQYRRATESARASLLASQYAQEVVRVTLIDSVATDYFLLRQYDDQLEFSKKTVQVDTEILKLNQIKFKGGESAITDVYQAQTLLQQAEAQVSHFGVCPRRHTGSSLDRICLARCGMARSPSGWCACPSSCTRPPNRRPFASASATAPTAPRSNTAAYVCRRARRSHSARP